MDRIVLWSEVFYNYRNICVVKGFHPWKLNYRQTTSYLFTAQQPTVRSTTDFKWSFVQVHPEWNYLTAHWVNSLFVTVFWLYSVGTVVGRGGGGPPPAAAATPALPHPRQCLTMASPCASARGPPQGGRKLLVSWTQATDGRSRYHYHTTNVLN